MFWCSGADCDAISDLKASQDIESSTSRGRRHNVCSRIALSRRDVWPTGYCGSLPSLWVHMRGGCASSRGLPAATTRECGHLRAHCWAQCAGHGGCEAACLSRYDQCLASLERYPESER